jgi:WD40 repeat protein
MQDLKSNEVTCKDLFHKHRNEIVNVDFKEYIAVYSGNHTVKIYSVRTQYRISNVKVNGGYNYHYDMLPFLPLS